MPSYAKFLKEILSNKKKIVENETVMLTAECSAIIQNNMPPKLKDPGTTPYIIGKFVIDKALCDLGASISLMPLSICKRLNMGELRPTRNLTDLSANCRDILVGLMSPSLSFSQIDKGIRLTLAPKSHRALSMTDFPITHGMEKLPGSFSFGGMLFWIMALHSAVSITVSFSTIFFLIRQYFF